MSAFAISLKRSYLKIFALLASTSALAMLLLDSGTFSLALPTIQIELNLSSFQLQWLLNAYFLTTAACVIVGGKIGDVVGYRKSFVCGLLLFAISNIVVGESTTYLSMIVGRIVQGLSAAIIGPIGFAIIFDTFPRKERGRAIGISAGIGSFFLVLGPLIAGFLVEFFGWRRLFWLFLPIALAGMIFTLISVKEPKQKEQQQVDYISLGLIVLGVSSLVVSLMQLRVWGLNSLYFSLALGAGVLSLAMVYLKNKKQAEPFIDVSIFKNRYFNVGILISCLSWMVMVNPIFWSIFLQKGLYYSPVETATYLIISTLPVLLSAPASGLIADKKGTLWPVMMGLLSILLSVFLMMLFSLYQEMFFLILAFFSFGIGNSLIFTPVGNMALSQIPAAKRGFASGVYNTMRFFGSALGIIIIGYIRYHCRQETFNRLSQGSSFSTLSYKEASNLVVDATSTLSSSDLSVLKNLVTTSSFAAFSAVNICTGLIVIVALLLTLVYLKDYREGD